MENKQSPSKKKLLSIKEEKLIREVNYDCTENYKNPKKDFLLDLDIFRKNPTRRQPSQRVLVSIKQRAPAIKTIYIAEKSRYHSKKGSEKSGSRSRLGIGDHSSFTTHFSDSGLQFPAAICLTEKKSISSELESEVRTSTTTTTTDFEKSDKISSCSQIDHLQSLNVFKPNQRPAEKCYVYTQPQFTMNLQDKAKKSKVDLNKVDIGTLIITNTSSEESVPKYNNTLNKLQNRIDHLERKILRQEMVFRTIDPNLQLSSSDEECKEHKMKAASGSGRPGCSYVQQYSHIPETSAFQRYAQHSSQLAPNKATTLEKEHNSEQYGRDFTAYDGITARGRRQCASVPCKRDQFPKMAADRVHKIRHKLNPVRDYRLMDTVHYLAQGEFAPRDDGIKLTPSREAVLSDIIWEDVCRTHWPNARLGRRAGQPERCSTRCELQRLIDSLLRERVAHVERRRRRHYRIVKLNHRNESSRPVGKTGDIIVASHKKNNDNDEREVPISDNAASAMMASRRREVESSRRGHRSHDRLASNDTRQRRRFRQEECSPGPSYAMPRPPGREATCCYHTTSPMERNLLVRNKPARNPLEKNPTERRQPAAAPKPERVHHSAGPEIRASCSSCTSKPHPRNPRLVIKKDMPCRRMKDEPNLEQYIVLPTLVIRTPSNVKRQKKFNELYHRILNVQMNNAEDCAVDTEAVERKSNSNSTKKDIGLNVNIIT